MKNVRIPKGLVHRSSSISTLNFASKLIVKWRNVWKLISPSSSFIKYYYLEASFVHIKKNLIGMINVVTIYFCTSVCFNLVMDHRETLPLMFGLLCLIFNLHCHLAILYIDSYNYLEKFHLFFVIVTFISLLIQLHLPLPGSLEMNFTPILQLSLTHFSNLQIDFNVSFIIWIISFGFIVLVFAYRWEYRKDMFNAVLVNKSYDDVQLVQDHGGKFVLIIAMIYFAICFTLICTYLYFINTFYRKLSFNDLGQFIQTKSQLRSAIKIQLDWIDAIMPKIVKDEYLEHTQDIKLDKWVYIKNFENVSILFADIVGFTVMSSNKTATEIVALLNDLFNNFDELCVATNCEKLGTLGDCYYCVSGCPMPRLSHAVSCIEMGLGMCRSIINFNERHSESVQMRVGIHTGRVNAAVIGKKRFRLDVYSNDVIIASAMESSGKPGFVHISETVYEYARNVYTVERGEDLEIKKEQDHGISGMILKSSTIKTYFIDPQSTHIHLDLSVLSKKSINLLRVISKNISSLFNETEAAQSNNIITYASNMRERERKVDIKFIKNLEFDPQKRIKHLTNSYLTSFFLSFKDSEIEWHFDLTCRQLVTTKIPTWLRLGPLIDSTICFIYSSLIYIGIFFLFTDISRKKKLLFVLQYSFSIFFIIFICLQCTYTKHETRNSLSNIVHAFFCHPFSRFLICFYFVYVPLIIVIYIINDCTRLYIDFYYTMKYFLIIFFTIFHVPLFISARFCVKIIIGFITIVTSALVFMNEPCLKLNPLHYSCYGQMNMTNIAFYKIVQWNFVFQICFLFVVFISIIRNIESNIRLLFYIGRENDINTEEASNAKRKARELLYNIFPKYVFNYLINQPENQKEVINFYYSTTVPNAAVMFACISNFFSKYYREDYKCGENALKLLHKIICGFDDLLSKDDKYRSVEKIKTINDCYMVASGLNLKQIKKAGNKKEHLYSLMHYAFDMIKSLESFNEKFIIGTDKFEIKIGYNFGPVTAGIIGTSKPMYDIWGDTVNVSSRMYSTGSAGKIQVPDYVCFEMNKEFNFKYRGKIFVKGKGEMSTYTCISPLSKYEKLLMENRSAKLNDNFLRSFYKSTTEKMLHERTEKYAEKVLKIHKKKVPRKSLRRLTTRLNDFEKRKLFVGFDVT